MTQPCQHHWVIETAHGPTSKGICQKCGEIKEFTNYSVAASWGHLKENNDDGADGPEEIE